jgi:hypothetical protein
MHWSTFFPRYQRKKQGYISLKTTSFFINSMDGVVLVIFAIREIQLGIYFGWQPNRESHDSWRQDMSVVLLSFLQSVTCSLACDLLLLFILTSACLDLCIY